MCLSLGAVIPSQKAPFQYEKDSIAVMVCDNLIGNFVVFLAGRLPKNFPHLVIQIASEMIQQESSRGVEFKNALDVYQISGCKI
ncbi:MAG TPA: hypothetical protein DD426_12460, partial [Clostridiaceae bacterium]|nr:hypothetical protein [Clostridiaceae bacterium]